SSLAEDSSDTNRARWLEMMRRLLVPALSLSKHNISLTEEVYQLLMLFPLTTRYNIYAEWFTGKTSRLPEMKVAFEHNRAEVKDVLRRVSNENVKVQARALGKVSYSSPGVLMMFMISQLESYSNMIPALVECTKYFPKLAYDVLTWCLINSLRGQGRDRIQADGMLTSSWLQALSQFVAALFHHYASVNPSPILQYLASELRNGNSTDLEMFEQVLTEMAGIRSDTEFNDAQVLAMAGGEHLQAHIMQQLADTRHERKSSAKRLMKALAEPGLIGQTLIAIAQERQMYQHHESSRFMPLKVLGNNLDKIQSVFAQYLDVLRTNLKPEEFEAAVPDVVALVGDFGLQPGIAFTINRYAIAYRMQEATRREDTQAKERRASQESGQASGDVEMQEADTKSTSKSQQLTKGDTVVCGNGEDQVVAQIEPKASATPQPNGVESAKSPWHPALESLIERLPSVTGDLQHRVSISFLVTFWTLGLSDVMAPLGSYNTEVNRLQDQIKQLIRDRPSMPVLSRVEHDRKKRALQDKQTKIGNEKQPRMASQIKLGVRMKREMDHWFDRSRKREDMVQRHLALLQECFLPRAMLSSLDAHCSFVLLRMLHQLGTPGFSTLVIIQQLLRKQALAAIISKCTGQEAQHIGRFLNEVLKMIAGWHANREDFETHALGVSTKLPGFVVGPMDYSEKGTWKFLDYESFRRLDSDWHHAILGSLLACFDSGEYMHIRNGIMVLKAIVGVYPQIQFHGNQLVGAVEKLSTEETRQDLKLMALSLLGPLKGREKQWVMPQAFRLNDPSKGGKPASRAPSARAETPQPAAGTPKLNAAATEFKPTPTSLAMGTSRKGSVIGVEDGEVEEEKKSADTEMKDAPAPASAQQSEQRPGLKPQTEPKATTSEPAKDQQTLPSKPPTPAPSVAKPPTPAAPAPRSQPPTNGIGRNELERNSLKATYKRNHNLSLKSAEIEMQEILMIFAVTPETIAMQDSTAKRSPQSRRGRLSSDFGREESSYGRLNAPPESVLVAPRPTNGLNGPGGRGGRLSSAPQPVSRLSEHPMPSPTASRPPQSTPRLSEHSMQSPTVSRVPESPAAFNPQQRPSRHPSFDTRNTAPQIDQRQQPQQQQSQPATPGQPTPTNDLAGMNPERLKLFTNIGSNVPQSQPSLTSAPPSGPRAAAARAPTNAPTGPSPVSAAPPSGPASAVDRQRGRRQGGLINQALQSTTANAPQGSRGQDVSFRGASTRQNSITMSSAAVVTPVPAVAPLVQSSQRFDNGPPRNEAQSNRPDLHADPRHDLPQRGQRPEVRDDSKSRRREEERARGSRHASRERRPDDEPPHRPQPTGMDDSRDKRGAPREDRRARDERDAVSHDRRGGQWADDTRRPPPTDTQGSMAGPAQNNYPHGGYPPDSHRQGPAPADGRRGGARQEEYRGGRREDERRDGAGRGGAREEAPQDRKRRHEDPPFGAEKRRRSGR
ncbi:hypothetical protein B0A55_11270, partial [Friedmanniomyces simplex]